MELDSCPGVFQVTVDSNKNSTRCVRATLSSVILAASAANHHPCFACLLCSTPKKISKVLVYVAQGSERHLEFCDSDGDSMSKGADGEAEGKSLLDCAVAPFLSLVHFCIVSHPMQHLHHWTLPNKSQHEEPFPKFPQRPPYFGLSFSSYPWLLFSVLLCCPRKVNFQPTPCTSSTASCPCIFPPSFPSSCFSFSFHFPSSSSFQHATFPADVHFFLLFLDDKRKIPTLTILTIKDRLKKGKKSGKTEGGMENSGDGESGQGHHPGPHKRHLRQLGKGVNPHGGRVPRYNQPRRLH